MQFIVKIIGKLLPVGLISTCCGIGFFPDWQRHWAAAFALLISVLVMYFTGAVFETEAVLLATPLMISAIIFFLIGWPSLYLYRAKRSDIEDKLVVDIFVAQIAVLAFSVPAILEINGTCMVLVGFFCTGVWQCASWFYVVMYYVFFFGVPYFFLRLFDVFNLWPGSRLVTIYNASWANMLVGLSAAFYSIFTLYAIAFVILDLELPSTLDFLCDLMVGTKDGFISIGARIVSWFEYISIGGFIELMDQVGLKGVLENYGVLDKLGPGEIETPGVFDDLDEVLKDLEEE